jgi:hypothetical protein
MTTSSRILAAVAGALAALAAAAVLAAAPAPAATHGCSTQANATGIVVRNLSCSTGRRIINAYGQNFSGVRKVLSYRCKVVQLDRNSNPIVRCVRASHVVLWHAV